MATSSRAIVVGSYAVGLTMRTDSFPVAGETRLGWGFEEGPGGKGSNQAIGLARLGAPVAFVGCVGDDRYGREAVALLEREGVDVAGVTVAADEPTGIGFIVLDRDGDNVIVLDPGANRRLDAPLVRRQMASGAHLGPADVVLTQLEIQADAATAALVAGRAAGATTILNPAPAQLLADETFATADVVTPNETELRVLSGLAPDADADDEELARRLIERGAGTIVVTRGSAGALIVSLAATRVVPAPMVDVVDSTGAGDAFNAALAAALLNGNDVGAAVFEAVVAGALACTRAAVVPSLPSRADLDQALHGVAQEALH